MVGRMHFLGVDLGKTPRDSSGGVALEVLEDGAVRVISAESLRTHEDLLRWITRNRGRGGCLICCNAPMIVENTSGSRPCDRQLLTHFARYRIDEYANNIVSSSHSRTTGRALMRMGFNANPASEGDRIIETHTQAAEIMLFGLERPVRLKSGPLGARKEAVSRFRDLVVHHLGNGYPALVNSPALEPMLQAHLPDLNGTRLGELEERMEALLCAYIAAFLGMRGPDYCAMLGDMQYGYILLPDPGRQREEEEDAS